jgi:hypothetical protein
MTIPEPETTIPEPETTIPEPETTIPEPETTIPEPETTIPEPETTVPEPEPEMTVPESMIAPEPETTVPEPETVPISDPVIVIPNRKRSTEQSPDTINSTLNDTFSPSPATLNDTVMNFTSQWIHVFYTPKTFNVTILSNQSEIFYTSSKNTPCMPILDYWKDDTLGCPCNGTWNITGSYNLTTESFEGGRQIVPSECVSNTCHEAFFLNDTVTYGKLRINITTFDNGTVANKTIEMTRRSPQKEIGYGFGDKDIVYVFQWMNETETIENVPEVVDTEPEDDTMSGGAITIPITSIVTIMFALLLVMYESAQ